MPERGVVAAPRLRTAAHALLPSDGSSGVSIRKALSHVRNDWTQMRSSLAELGEVNDH